MPYDIDGISINHNKLMLLLDSEIDPEDEIDIYYEKLDNVDSIFDTDTWGKGFDNKQSIQSIKYNKNIYGW